MIKLKHRLKIIGKLELSAYFVIKDTFFLRKFL